MLAFVAPSVVHFTWEAVALTGLKPPAETTAAAQAEVLEILRKMVNLESLSLALRPDSLFFAALRTLPRLRTLRLSLPSPNSPVETSSSLAEATFK